MSTQSNDRIKLVTSQLSQDVLWNLDLEEQDVTYQTIPFPPNSPQAGPHWRIRLDLTHHPDKRLGLDLNGEVALGRGEEEPGFLSLDPFDAEELGVSRHHVVLRPTESKLYIVDLGSTNGTRCNGRSIGVNTPYSLANGALLTLGKMDIVVRIYKRPTGQTGVLHEESNLEDVILPIAQAISAQLEVEDVLKLALDYTRSIASVDEASIWLIDEQSGELFLEAEEGINDEQVRRMRLPVADSLAGQVIETGRPARANRVAGGEQIKVKTGYLVEAVMYVPLKLGGVTFGVLAAAHRQDGRAFNEREEKLVSAIADFTATAIQNARLHQATDRALVRHSKLMTALNSTLSFDLKKLLNSALGYAGLLQSSALDEETGELARHIFEAANAMADLTDRLIEASSLCQGLPLKIGSCDLLDVAMRAVADLEAAAGARRILLDLHVMGNPYLIQGDGKQLYRAIHSLVENAVKFSPDDRPVDVRLAFSRNDVLLTVRDYGDGIPEDDLPDIFTKYFRSQQTLGGKPSLGLGLELAQTIVEAHKGTLTARNVDDAGAEFIVTLPGELSIKPGTKERPS